MTGSLFLRHRLLESCGVGHGFGTRGARAPAGLRRPRQSHGAAVVRLLRSESRAPERADAIVCDRPDVPVGVVTADCVPILLASGDGNVVAAVHAGWRGLVRGVIPAAFEVFSRAAKSTTQAVAVLGPHVGACCYEVDGPLVHALEPRFGGRLEQALEPRSAGHWSLSLGTLARFELVAAGLLPERIGALENACTACDPRRFFSYRRSGPGAGRLVHFVTARGQA